MTPEQAEMYYAAWRLKIAVELMMADLSKGESVLAVTQIQAVGRWFEQVKRKAKDV